MGVIKSKTFDSNDLKTLQAFEAAIDHFIQNKVLIEIKYHDKLACYGRSVVTITYQEDE